MIMIYDETVSLLDHLPKAFYILILENFYVYSQTTLIYCNILIGEKR